MEFILPEADRWLAKSDPGLPVAGYKMVMFCLYNPGFVENMLVAHRKVSPPACCVIQSNLMPHQSLGPAEEACQEPKYSQPRVGQDELCWAALRNGMVSEGQLPAAQVTTETLGSTSEAIAAVRPRALVTKFHYIKITCCC